MYRVSHQLVLTFNFNSWLFWLSYCFFLLLEPITWPWVEIWSKLMGHTYIIFCLNDLQNGSPDDCWNVKANLNTELLEQEKSHTSSLNCNFDLYQKPNSHRDGNKDKIKIRRWILPKKLCLSELWKPSRNQLLTNQRTIQKQIRKIHTLYSQIIPSLLWRSLKTWTLLLCIMHIGITANAWVSKGAAGAWPGRNSEHHLWHPRILRFLILTGTGRAHSM